MFRVVGNNGQKDRDYLTVPANEVRQIQPVMTMVGGEVVHEAAD